MATITAILNKANPNTPADDTTPDVDLTYKVYNDTDNYLTPELFGKSGTTGVTVSLGVVTILGVTEPVGVSAWKIGSVDEDGKESPLSDPFVASIILFEDDFAGTSIDTTKWTIEPNPDANCVITQDDGLIFTDAITDLGPGAGTTKLTSDGKWNYDPTGKDLVMIVYANKTGITVPDSPRSSALTDFDFSGDYTRTSMGNQDTTNLIALVNIIAGSVIRDDSPINNWDGDFKIVMKNSNKISSLYKWNTGLLQWDLIASDTFVQANDYHISHQRDTHYTVGNVWEIGYCCVLSEDIATKRP